MSAKKTFCCAECGVEKAAVFTTWGEPQGDFDGQGVCANCGAKFCGECMDSMDRVGNEGVPFSALDRSVVMCGMCGGRLYATDAWGR